MVGLAKNKLITAAVIAVMLLVIVPTPAVHAIPSANSAGVPGTAILTNQSGDINVTADGTVIDSKNLTGCIVINANNVTISNTRVRCTSDLPAVTVRGSGAQIINSDLAQTRNTNASLLIMQTTGTTVRHSLVTGGTDNVQSLGSSSIIMEENRFEGAVALGTVRSDAVQILSGSNVQIRNNLIKLPSTAGYYGGVFIKNDFGTIDNITVEKNNFEGGTFGVYCIASNNPQLNTLIGPGANTPPTNCKVTNNTFAPNSFVKAAILMNDAAGNIASCNVFLAINTAVTVYKSDVTNTTYPSSNPGNCTPGLTDTPVTPTPPPPPPPAPTGPYTVTTVTPTVALNGVGSMSWQVTGPTTPKDWVGLFKVGAPDNSVVPTAWKFTNGATTGTFSWTITEAGQYEWRMYQNDSYVKLATSSVMTVGGTTTPPPAPAPAPTPPPAPAPTPPPPTGTGYTLTTATPTVALNGVGRVTWQVTGTTTPKDWVGLFKVGAPDNGVVPTAWKFTNGATTGEFTWTITEAGQYEWRMYKNDSYVKLATSSVMTVGSTPAPPPPAPAPVPPPVVTVQPCTSLSNQYGLIDYTQTITTAATYTVWVRMRAADPNATISMNVDSTDRTRSCAVQVKDSAQVNGNTWTWVNKKASGSVFTVDLLPNTSKVQLTALSQYTNVGVDRVLLVKNNCVPVDKGDNCVDGVAVTPPPPPPAPAPTPPPPTPTPTPTPPPSNIPPAGTTWLLCAYEGVTCSFPGTRYLRYGANGAYKYGIFTGSVLCTATAFGGDPAPGVAKQCDHSVQTTTQP